MLFEYMEYCASTQELLKELYKNKYAVLFDAVYAHSQSEGKGRYGKSFYSPKGGLYFSMLLPYEETENLTRGAGACAVKAIKSVTGKEPRIKPVNDLYLDGKKIAGILAEAITDLSGKPQCVILGIGINLVMPAEGFPEDIKEKAGALYPSIAEIGWIGRERKLGFGENSEELSLTALRSQLAHCLIKEFSKLSDPQISQKLLEEYEALLMDFWKKREEEPTDVQEILKNT